jgi:hypothetical protein
VEALTSKQAKFVAEYLVDNNGSRAAREAGYGVSGASVASVRLLANARVQKALQARQSADATRLSIQREDAIQGLLGAIQLARAQGNPAAMIAGWKTLGSMLGFFEPKRLQVEVSAAQDAEMGRYERMTDAELLSAIAAS